MTTKNSPFPGFLALLALLIATFFVGSCSKTNPVEPTTSTPPPAGGGAYTISLSVNPTVLPLGSTDPATVTVSVIQVSTGAPATNVTAGLSTSLGSFDSSRSVKVTSVQIKNGTGTAQLYAGTESGTATLTAQVETSVNQLSVPIRQSTIFISSIEPNRGVAEGGDVVTIKGGGFVAPLRVTFGGVVSPKVTFVSATEIRATSPRSPTPVDANSTLTVGLTVTAAIDKPNAPSDTLADGFTYTSGTPSIDRPVIFSVSPPAGPNEGGTQVSIFGSFLPTTIAGTQVSFGFQTSAGLFDGVDATVTAATSTRIDVITPPAAGLGAALQNQQVDVLVRNRDTGFFTVARTIFKYGESLIITDVQPRSGPVAGGTKVTIKGQGFKAPVQVLIAGIPQPVNSGSPYACTPAGSTCIDVTLAPATVNNCSPPSGLVAVTNLNTGQTVTSSVIFTYTAPHLSLTSLSPTAGAAAGGTSVVISGQMLPTGQPVRATFNDAPATIAAFSSAGTALSVITPPYNGSFDTQSCTTSDGAAGTRFVNRAVDVQVTDLSSGCTDTLKTAYTYQTDNTCHPNNTAPVADFIFDTFNGFPLRLHFFDRSTGNPTTWLWDFGDNLTSTQQNPVHNYNMAGTYRVSLTVQNGSGSNSITKTVTVPVPVSPQGLRK